MPTPQPITTQLAALTATTSPADELNDLLADLQGQGFPITAWQAGRVGRTVLQVIAQGFSSLSGVEAQIAQGGFRATAAAMPTQAWLALLAEDFYDLTPAAATFARTQGVLSASSSAAPKSIAAGTLVASDGAGHLFNNLTGGVLNPGNQLLVTWGAQSPGSASNVGDGALTQLVTSLAGVSLTNPPQLPAGGATTQIGSGDGTVTVFDSAQAYQPGWATTQPAVHTTVQAGLNIWIATSVLGPTNPSGNAPAGLSATTPASSVVDGGVTWSLVLTVPGPSGSVPVPTINSNPFSGVVEVKIVAQGPVGTATFQYSLDSGSSWWPASPLTTGPAVVLPNTTSGNSNVVLSFDTSDGNFSAGTIYELACTSLLQAGEDAETNAELDARCGNQWGTLGQGNTTTGYEAVIQAAAPDIRRILVAPPDGLGNVQIYVATDSGPVNAQDLQLAQNAVAPNLISINDQANVSNVNVFTLTVTGNYFYTGTDPGPQIVAALEAWAAALPINGTPLDGTGDTGISFFEVASIIKSIPQAPPEWTANTAVVFGDYAVDLNGNCWLCVGPGTTGPAIPAFPANPQTGAEATTLTETTGVKWAAVDQVPATNSTAVSNLQGGTGTGAFQLNGGTGDIRLPTGGNIAQIVQVVASGLTGTPV